MFYRPIIDGDGEHAKKCVDCEKIFYVGETCPFCKDEKICRCGSVKTGNLWTIPAETKTTPERAKLCPACKLEEEELLQVAPLMRDQ